MKSFCNRIEKPSQGDQPTLRKLSSLLGGFLLLYILVNVKGGNQPHE
jgi:hypothetical protein